MVNKERVALIPAALRKMKEDGTPAYMKGQGFLHNLHEDTWCCLGAASAEAAAHGLPLRREREESVLYSVPYESFGETGGHAFVLCAEVAEWYGFDSSDPILLTPSGDEMRASDWNDRGPDGCGPEAVFGPIADAFERTYLTPSVNALVSQCLSDLKDDAGQLPTGFQCMPGAGSTLALSGK
jgi:hypothetical protein